MLILDEATSSLDLATESLIERALDVLLEGRTAVLIAHRLNTAMRADRIAVVEDGALAEVGPHDELIALNGRYAEMFTAWQQSHEAHVFEAEHRAVQASGSVGAMDELPRTTAVLNDGIARGLHLGAQGYVWHAGRDGRRLRDRARRGWAPISRATR